MLGPGAVSCRQRLQAPIGVWELFQSWPGDLIGCPGQRWTSKALRPVTARSCWVLPVYWLGRCQENGGLIVWLHVPSAGRSHLFREGRCGDFPRPQFRQPVKLQTAVSRLTGPAHTIDGAQIWKSNPSKRKLRNGLYPIFGARQSGLNTTLGTSSYSRRRTVQGRDGRTGKVAYLYFHGPSTIRLHCLW